MVVSNSNFLKATDLSVQQIRTFLAVCRYGGYAEASRSLDIPPPTLWEQVRGLETVYRSKLFTKKGRNVVPTASGETLRQILAPLLEGLESSFELVTEKDGKAPNELRLVTGVRMVMEELQEPLRQFQLQYPDMKITLMTADSQTAQAMVLEKQADIALLIEPSNTEIQKGLQVAPIYPLEFIGVAHRDHRFAKRKPSNLEQFLREPIILGNPKTVGRQLFDHAVFRQGFTANVRIAVETDNSAITIACVQAGMGVGVIAGRMPNEKNDLVRMFSLAKELGRVNIASMTIAGRQLPQAFQSFLNIVKSKLS